MLLGSHQLSARLRSSAGEWELLGKKLIAIQTVSLKHVPEYRRSQARMHTVEREKAPNEGKGRIIRIFIQRYIRKTKIKIGFFNMERRIREGKRLYKVTCTRHCKVQI